MRCWKYKRFGFFLLVITLQMSRAAAGTGRPSPCGFQDEEYKHFGTLGSRPPICEHKCEGCAPCRAFQIPTNMNRLGTQYANYEPESWKCKCGSTFYDP
ncbi:EPIDERMAL PATTERNING FACTOR-like protein 2 [Zingiber officinale]|uniref:EPIDERMAL PATTERNING FACTOR-like protein 2 n=1 Tax=Zingiber officinale TaxID=94328 RepID=UPI001C4D9EB3|nr:EPIDERMAL PATTERNING FACTOR-like protein 2 [Zingiber officinale]